MLGTKPLPPLRYLENVNDFLKCGINYFIFFIVFDTVTKVIPFVWPLQVGHESANFNDKGNKTKILSQWTLIHYVNQKIVRENVPFLEIKRRLLRKAMT